MRSIYKHPDAISRWKNTITNAGVLGGSEDIGVGGFLVPLISTTVSKSQVLSLSFLIHKMIGMRFLIFL